MLHPMPVRASLIKHEVRQLEVNSHTVLILACYFIHNCL